MAFFVNLAQIVLIDISLAGENALAIGMAVSSLPQRQRTRATVVGIAGATVLRIVLAFLAVRLLRVTGILAAGGFLLLWVAWKIGRDIYVLHGARPNPDKAPAKKISDAVWQIVVADVSMSLDNVLGVAGVARDHFPELVIGLTLSIALMGVASSHVARLTARYPKAAYVGVAVVLATALRMIYDGARQFPV
jgi:YjbE family integral membrane protein